LRISSFRSHEFQKTLAHFLFPRFPERSRICLQRVLRNVRLSTSGPLPASGPPKVFSTYRASPPHASFSGFFVPFSRSMGPSSFEFFVVVSSLIPNINLGTRLALSSPTDSTLCSGCYDRRWCFQISFFSWFFFFLLCPSLRRFFFSFLLGKDVKRVFFQQDPDSNCPVAFFPFFVHPTRHIVPSISAGAISLFPPCRVARPLSLFLPASVC